MTAESLSVRTDAATVLPRLVHYSSQPLDVLHRVSQDSDPSIYAKPAGLWLSTEDDDGWREWCLGEGYGLDRLSHVYDVTLASDAEIAWLRSPEEIDAFTERYGAAPAGQSLFEHRYAGIDWCKVALQHQGIIIAPYVWERRLSFHTLWYYGWDCASGCIWDTDAIASVTLRLPDA